MSETSCTAISARKPGSTSRSSVLRSTWLRVSKPSPNNWAERCCCPARSPTSSKAISISNASANIRSAASTTPSSCLRITAELCSCVCYEGSQEGQIMDTSTKTAADDQSVARRILDNSLAAAAPAEQSWCMTSGLLEDASLNQSPNFGDVDLFSADRPLADAARRAGLDLAQLAACGKDYGSAETLDLGRLANENPPKLRTMDARGNRIDFVESHPAYHALMAKSIGHGIHASAHDGSDKAAPMAGRAVRLYLATQAESGHLCPVVMTHACIGALRAEPALLANWLPKILTRDYDPRPRPWWEKTGVTLGMGMTERQGGTDVR